MYPADPANISSPLFAVQVTAKSGSGTAAEYQFIELWLAPTTLAAGEKVASGRFAGSNNLAYCLAGELSVGDVALARSADGTGGRNWELLPLGIGATVSPQSCSGFGWVAGLRLRDRLRVTVEDDEDDENTLTLSTAHGVLWEDPAEGTITVCGALFTAVFDRGDAGGPKLTLTYVSGAAAGVELEGDYEGVRDCGGCDYAVFAFNRCALGCDDATGGGCGNLVKLRVELVSCSGDQAFDVELPCCAGVLFPRVISVERRKCNTGELWGYGWSAVTQSAFDMEWDPDFDAVWWSPSNGAWVGTRADGASLVFGCNFHAADSAWWWELVEADTPMVLASIRVGDCPADPAAAFELLLNATGQTQTPGDPPVTDQDACDGVIPNEDAPLEVYFRVVACADAGCEGSDEPCTIRGWGGAGWYCVNVSGVCTAVELLAADECDEEIVICTGPYANEAAAIAGCGTSPPEEGTLNCCPGYESAPGVGAVNCLVSVTNQNFACDLGGGSAGITSYVGGAQFQTTSSADGFEIKLYCVGGSWLVLLYKGGTLIRMRTIESSVSCTFAGITLIYRFELTDPVTCGGVTYSAGARFDVTFTLT